MAQYVNVSFETYIRETDLTKAVLIKTPVPENINPVKTLNGFVKNILKDKKKLKGLNFSNILEKKSRSKSMSYCFVIKILNSSWVSQIIAGGFSGGWLKTNSGVCGINCSTAETSIEFHIPLQKSYMLFALTGSPQQNKKMLREDSELLQKNDKIYLGKTSVKTSGTEKQTLKWYRVHRE